MRVLALRPRARSEPSAGSAPTGTKLEWRRAMLLDLNLASLAGEPFFQAVQKKPAPDGPEPVHPHRQDWHRRQAWKGRNDRNYCYYNRPCLSRAEVTALVGEV
jgi:hypothetical protein